MAESGSKHTRKQSKEIVYRVYKYLKNLSVKSAGEIKDAIRAPQKATAEASGLSERTVRRICAEGYNVKKTLIYENFEEDSPSTSFSSPKKNARRPVTNIDDRKKDVIRRTILDFYDRKEYPTTKKVRESLREIDEFEGSITSLRRIFKDLGFKYKKANDGRKFLMERTDVAAARATFLRKMHHLRTSNDTRPVIYLDETWVNKNHTRQFIWQDSENSGGMKVPIGKGERLIVCHAGSAQHGFIQHAKLVFQSKSTEDYHQEMNAEVFHDWFINLLQGLEEGCIIVMDNAVYHSTLKERAPTTASRKAEIITWLRNKNISFEESCTKSELLNIVRQHKSAHKVYVLDELALQMGHEVIRLPPYHCQYNPIELIWAQVKGYVAEHNTTFTMTEVRRLLEEGISRVTVDDWKKCAEKTDRIQEEDFKKEMRKDEEINELLEFAEDSSSTSDSSSNEDV